MEIKRDLIDLPVPCFDVIEQRDIIMPEDRYIKQILQPGLVITVQIRIPDTPISSFPRASI